MVNNSIWLWYLDRWDYNGLFEKGGMMRKYVCLTKEWSCTPDGVGNVELNAHNIIYGETVHELVKRLNVTPDNDYYKFLEIKIIPIKENDG